MEKTVRDIMQRGVATCSPQDSVQEAAKRMVSLNTRGLVVVDPDGEACGWIDENDVLEVWGKDLSSLEVEDVMSNELVKVHPAAAISAAAKLLLDRNAPCLLIVHGDPVITNRPVGVLWPQDIIAELTSSEEG